jgi:Fe-S cluster assembly protein SufD|uniref:ATP-binding cassette superfamily n=1 Tax=Micromonas pusilla TaxID=38833 RepID=A0A7R9Y182_MICPS
MSARVSSATPRAAAAAKFVAGSRRRTTTSSSRVATRRVAAAATAAEASTIEDKWIAGSVERCAIGAGVESLRAGAVTQLARARMPTSRAEEFRFTDLAPLLTKQPTAADASKADDVDASAWTFEAANASRVVLVDGVFRADKSSIDAIAKGGAKISVSAAAAGDAAPPAALGSMTSTGRGGVLASLNAVMASDVVHVDVPAGVTLDVPIHIVQLSTSGDDAAELSSSAPRIVITVGERASVEVVEEFAPAPGVSDDACGYWHNGVCEIVIEKDGRVTHAMVQAQTRNAVHTRLTTLTQAESSTYALAEVNVGGKIGRHDLGIEQLGPRTVTELSCFNLAGAGQCMDLHSSVTLDHEEGKTDQVHKCIVSSASGRGVFDGNVKVNKLAQRTDAGQISRNLLLVPKATVNVKPNLQIVADDVVCTHGCTVSDLEEEELFYIQSRGLSPAVARSLLVAGFGLEIVSKLPGGKDIRDRVGALVKASLDKDDVQLVA